MNNKLPVTVLLVEDNTGDVRLIQELLATVPQIKLEYVNQLADALTFLAHKPVDAVLLDLHLPDRVGLETLIEVRKRAPQIPVVVLTIADDEKLGLQAIHVGAQDYLVKGQINSREVTRSLQYAIERNRTREQLRASEERFRLLVEGVKDYAIYMMDPAGTITVWNPGGEQIHGYRTKEIIGQSHARFFTPEDIEAGLPRQLRELAIVQGEATAEGWRVRKDGSRFWANGVLTALFADDGTVLGFCQVLRDLTERKEAEETLHRFANRQAAILDALPAHIALLDSQGEILAVNQAWQRFANANVLQADDFGMGQNYLEICDRARGDCSEEAAEVAAGIRAVLRGESPEFTLEYPCHSPAEQRWFRLMVTPLYEDRSDGAVVMHINITTRKLAEEQIKFQANLLSTVGEAVIATDLEGTIIYWNDTAEQLYGWLPAEVLGRNILEVTPPESTKEQGAEIMNHLRQGQPWSGEFLVQKKDGTTFPAFVTNSAIRDASGNLIGIIGVSTDISERKQAEAALRASEARFKGLLNSAPDAMIVVNEDGEIVLTNIQVETFFGYTSEELLGETIECLLPQRFGDVHVAHRADFFTNPRLRAMGADLELYGLHKDGSEFPVEVSLSYLVVDDEIIVISAIRDITARKQLERERQELLVREQAARRQADAASHYYRSLFEYAPGCYLVLTPDDFEIVAVSDAYLRATMTTREQIFGKRLFEVFPDDPTDMWADGVKNLRASLERVKSNGVSDVMAVQRYPIRRPESQGGGFEERYWSPVNSPVPGPDGELAFIIHRVEDVTEYLKLKQQAGEGPEAQLKLASRAEHLEADIVLRSRELRRANDELAHSQALLRMASHVGRLGGWAVDLPDYKLTWSDEVRAIHEAPPDYIPTLEEGINFYPPPYRQVIYEAFFACVQDGTPFDEELQIITTTGRRVWVRAIGEAVRDADGHIFRVQGAFQDISEQKRAKKLIIQSQQRFRQLADAMPLIVWTAEPDGMVDYANQAYTDYAGVLKTELPSEAWIRTLHPDDVERCLAQWGEAVRTDSIYEIEFRIRRQADESYRWHLVRAVPIRDESGKIVKWYGTGTDIHDSKLMQERASQLAQRLTTTLESITDAFFTLDKNWCFTYVNAEAERLLLRTREELLGQNVWAEFPEAVNSAFYHQYHQAIAEQKTVEFDEFYPPLDKWFGVRAYPSEVGLSIYFRDVTEQRQAQEDLRISEERFRLLSRATKDAIWDWNLLTDEVWWNEGIKTLFGYRPAELEPDSRSWTNRIHPDDRDRTVQSIRQIIDGGGSGWQHEYRFLRKDGSVAHVLDRGYVMRDAGGNAVRMIGGMTDMTERRKLEAQLQQSQKMEAIGQLAGGVAHDFNNLLTVITGNTELLLTTLDPDDPNRDLLTYIRDASERAANLTRQLLAFSRKQVLAPRVLDLNDVVSNIEKMLRRLIGEDIMLTSILRPNLHYIKVDPGQIEQVIINLALNARDAMPDGGRLTIETSTVEISEEDCENRLDYKPGRYVAMMITDTGRGMAPEIKEHIFEPFFTTKPQGKGTGLGLATVFGIVKQSEGQIDVESEVGAGTRFRMLFPVTNEPAAPGMADNTAARNGTETILFVEDESSVRQVAKLILHKYGYKVLEATNGKEAIKLVESNQETIHLVVTDVVMPEMSGRHLAEHLRCRYPEIKLLFMSGYTDDAVVQRGIIEEKESFLQKPFSPLVLAKKVRTVLDH